MPSRAALPLFLLLSVGGGLLIGTLNIPGAWYAELAKPSFNPPNWLFGPVWTVLYVLIAIAGWRTWRTARNGRAMKLWWAQMVLNFLWSPTFFGAERITLAAVIIFILLAAVLAFIAVTWRSDRVSAALFVPYALWVAFAALLNTSIAALN
jgi:benzodiazapine receptor